jgi:OmcA/MtrC family decaheme c-type cytochrome
MHTFRRSAALALAAIVAIAGCSGKDGANGANGANGTDLVNTLRPETCSGCHGATGGIHQSIYNKYTDASKLTATIDSVTSVAGATAGTFDATVVVSLAKDGVPYVAGFATFGPKSVYIIPYDQASGRFTNPGYNPFVGLTFVSNNNDGTYTYKATGLTYDPTASNAVVYAYFAEGPTIIPRPANSRIDMYADLANVAQTIGTVGYVSTANVAGCAKCHGAPYRKHGNIEAKVTGMPDFAVCMNCHGESFNGGDAAWQLLAEDPAAFAAQNGTTTAAQNAKYAYKRTLKNDVHMSHAMEFGYPQSMANCATCHEGKLTSVLTQANFTIQTCKSCHPVTSVAGVEPGRPPALADIMPLSSGAHMGIAVPAGLYEPYTAAACNSCHVDTSATLKFAAIHTGYDKQIYSDAAGTKYSSTITTSIGAVTYNATTKILTVPFTVTGANATAIIKPTVVISLYGYDTKDFIVSGHGSQADGTKNLEWAEGATQRGVTPPVSANSSRLTVAPAVATAGNASWTATADLTLWASALADGSVKKLEIGVLPVIGLNQAAASSTTNPGIAVKGATQSFDLVAKAATVAYGKAIVDAAKCSACHDALGTTFHTPSYGSAGVVACRLCHTVLDPGGHLEMQSRSIDSYVHAIHGMQAFDVGTINFADPVEKLRYEHKIESHYPTFTLLNCESCHNAGTFDVPSQSKSLPSRLSASATNATWSRTISGVPAYTTGPTSRACGSCHRTSKINADNAPGLTMFNKHVEDNGYLLEGTSAVLSDAIAKIMAFFQ